MAILCVAQDGHFIIIEVNFIDQHIDQPLPILGVVDIALAELVQEKANVLHAGNGVLGHIHLQLIGEFIMLFLLLGNPFGNNIDSLSAFQSSKQIICGLFIFTDELLKPRCIIGLALPLAEVNDLFGNPVDIIRGEELPEPLNHHIFNVLFVDSLFITGLVPTVGYTLVIVIFLFRLTRPANASHSGFTVPAEQLCGKQVIHFSLRPCGGLFIFLHDALGLLKQVLVNDARQSVRGFRIAVCIYPDVPFIFQNTVDAVLVELVSIGGFDVVSIEITDNISHGGASYIHFKDFYNHWSSNRVYHNPLILNFEA